MEDKYNCGAYDSGYCYCLGRPLTDKEDNICEYSCSVMELNEDNNTAEKNMKDDTLRVVYILDSAEGTIELKVLADAIEKRNDWILAIRKNQIVGGVKEECLKAFYLEDNI